MASLNGRVTFYGFIGLEKRARTNWFSKVGSCRFLGRWTLDNNGSKVFTDTDLDVSNIKLPMTTQRCEVESLQKIVHRIYIQ
jgi:hypothetical protein